VLPRARKLLRFMTLLAVPALGLWLWLGCIQYRQPLARRGVGYCSFVLPLNQDWLIGCAAWRSALPTN